MLNFYGPGQLLISASNDQTKLGGMRPLPPLYKSTGRPTGYVQSPQKQVGHGMQDIKYTAPRQTYTGKAGVVTPPRATSPKKHIGGSHGSQAG